MRSTPAAARVSTIWSATVRVMIFSLRSGAWFQWLSSERLTARGEVFGPGARPGLISSGLRGAMGLGVGRVTVAPFSSPIRGTQLQFQALSAKGQGDDRGCHGTICV